MTRQPRCSSTVDGGGKRRMGIYQARKRRAAGWSLSMRFARILPLPHFLQRNRFTKLAMGASGGMPKSAKSLLRKRLLWRQRRHRTCTLNALELQYHVERHCDVIGWQFATRRGRGDGGNSLPCVLGAVLRR